MPDTGSLRQFLSDLQVEAPIQLDAITTTAGTAAWKEVDCLACANCCRTMSPQFTPTDVKRISSYLRLSPKSLKEKWLYQTKDNTWMNRSRPCQFLDTVTNKCSIYAVRPEDCAGFPYFPAAQVVEYLPTYKQNIEFCPATVKLVEKMMDATGVFAED